MQLHHIDLDRLSVSAANMRGKVKTIDIANILPSVRSRGILVPLIVRATEGVSSKASDGACYEIIAGRRRFAACTAIREEGGEVEPLPCAILDADDDASALEASILENVARLDPDEVSRWECFVRLVKEGRTPEGIATTFGLTDLQVKRTLALGDLHPRIRTLYRNNDIDAGTIRHLTLATKAQQKAWLALLDDPDQYAPRGSQLKAWLFGGASIATSVALFDVAAFEGAIVSDLFGEDRYFADADQFWTAQHEAIAALAQQYREVGWADVVVLETGAYFARWDHDKRSKSKGGKVYIAIAYNGEVTPHEGYLTMKEARALAKGDEGETKASRPELSAPLTNYADLHRHAIVRERLTAEPALALRVMLAHAICGSCLWSVRPEQQRAVKDSIAESVENALSEAALDQRRRTLLDRLGFDPETPTIVQGYDGEQGISGLVMHLLDLSDVTVMDILAMVMAETLEMGTPLIEMLGRHLAIDMVQAFTPDEALIDLIRDRDLADAILAEVAGEEVATANAKATATVKRQIIADCLAGTNGRAKVESWVPRFMKFPPCAYTSRGGVPMVTRDRQIAALFEEQTDDAPNEEAASDLDEPLPHAA